MEYLKFVLEILTKNPESFKYFYVNVLVFINGISDASYKACERHPQHKDSKSCLKCRGSNLQPT